MLILILPSFFDFSFVPSFTLILYFSAKDFSATTWVRILKFATKLDSDELYCVTKNSYILLFSPFICSFSFSPMERSVTDFSAPIGANVLKFCVHLQVGKVYCVNGN